MHFSFQSKPRAKPLSGITHPLANEKRAEEREELSGFCQWNKDVGFFPLPSVSQDHVNNWKQKFLEYRQFRDRCCCCCWKRDAAIRFGAKMPKRTRGMQSSCALCAKLIKFCNGNYAIGFALQAPPGCCHHAAAPQNVPVRRRLFNRLAESRIGFLITFTKVDERATIDGVIQAWLRQGCPIFSAEAQKMQAKKIFI